jgi:hypothetical protein
VRVRRRRQVWIRGTDPEGAQRGGTPGAAPKITLANVPPILASPPASNLIAFSGNVLTIPD